VWQAFNANGCVAPALVVPLDGQYGIMVDTTWFGLLSPIGDSDVLVDI
jgi:hypothetical protein